MRNTVYRLRSGLMATVAATVLVAASPVLAAPVAPQGEARPYDLKVQPLAQALADVARISGRQVVVSSALVRGKSAPALSGRYTADEAYAAVLSGSGLKLTLVGDTLVVKDAGAPQGEPQAGDAEVLSELVVTGTRIRGAAPVGTNLITIGRDDIATSGYATTQQIVQAIPQNFGGGANDTTYSYNNRNNALNNAALGSSINLRGLGAESTLVLINGVRPAMGGIAGMFSDVSLIPTTAIERVEVLPDGASALYGSDAVGGVVNFVLRNRFEGVEARARYGTADGDFSEYQAGLVFGRSWRGGHATVAYEVYDRGRLSAFDRDFAREDLRALGGADNRKAYGAPGTLVAGGKTFAIPPGQNGIGLTPSQLVAGTFNATDQQAQIDLLPAQRRHSVYVAAQQDLGEDTEIFGRLLYADRTFDRRYVDSTAARSVTVPVTNLYYVDPIGTRAPVAVQYDFGGDLGVARNRGRAQAYNAEAGLSRRFGAWSATVGVGYGRQRDAWSFTELNTAKLAQAVASTNPATAYNLFGGPGSNSLAIVDAIRGYDGAKGVFEVWSGALRMDGPLFALPAGQARLAVGGEWRSEEFKQVSKSFYNTLTPFERIIDYPGARQISAAYAELRLPLVGPTMAWARGQSLDLSLAGRIERYSDVGDTANPKIGLDWRPIRSLTVRGSFGTSFRAPSFQDLRSGASVTSYQTAALSDSASPTGTSKVLVLIGNIPDIGPENATTWSAGFDYRSRIVPGLTAKATYFSIDYQDRLANVNANVLAILTNRAFYASLITDKPTPAQLAPYFSSPYFRNSPNYAVSDIAVIVDVRNRNLSTVKERGLDIDLGYGFALKGGQVSLGLAGTYIFDLRQRITDTSPQANMVGNVGFPAELRLRARASYAVGGWSASTGINFIDGYTNQLVTPIKPVASWTTVDARLAYRWPSGATIALSATNLFDRDPPFAEIRSTYSAIGYDGEKASPIGRLVAIEVSRSW
ncbi:TonB-dependent receptor [Caulobacter sp.]|uniref:TonB-dependent receptor n=1 Tax=Caulobacter sp. TaxID=78 RepID=UPI001B14AE90|nr:TonB-dependent receptor [Caulobacter sp.]MBO9547118.1 TonB-dependent receptor [Caulobacter sp.]